MQKYIKSWRTGHSRREAEHDLVVLWQLFRLPLRLQRFRLTPATMRSLKQFSFCVCWMAISQ